MTDAPGVQVLVGHHGPRTIAREPQPIINRASCGSAAPGNVPSFPLSPVPSFPRSLVPRGFTLIEILVVITVIAILAGLVSPMIFRNVGDAKVTAARSQIETLGLALDTYYLHNDYYPTTSQGLAALVVQPTGAEAPRNWRGPYLKRAVPLDPWGTPYHYESPGAVNAMSYDLVSYGRDGRPGGAGEDADITSWEGASR